MILTPLKLNPALNPTYVTDGAGLDRMVEYLRKSKKVLGWDKETAPVKDFYTRRDRLWQLGDRNEQFVIDLLSFVDGDSTILANCQGSYGKSLDRRLSVVVDACSPFLCSGDYLKVGVNLGFEYEQSYWNFGMRAWKFFSCDMVERLLKAGDHSLKDYGYYSMEEMVARYFSASIDKTLQTSFNLEDALTQDQINYAAVDVVLPLALRQLQYPLLKETSMIEIAEIENNAIGAFIDMHVHGLRLDKDKWNAIEAKHVEDFKKVIAELDTTFLPLVGSKNEPITDEQITALKAKWKAISTKDLERKEERDRLKKENSDLGKRRTKQRKLIAKCEGEALINYSSGAQVLDVLDEMPELLGLKSTDESDMSEYKNVPVIAAFLKYRKLSKSIKTYGKTWTSTWETSPGFKHKQTKETPGWQEGWLHPYDYRLHPKFNQLDAETGRSTSSQPNGQNIPKAPEVRACFVCDPPDADEPEGYSIITIDMAGAELRILAELSGEKIWIDAFNRGEDVHEVCAEMMYKDNWRGWAAPDCKYYALKADGTPAHQKCKCPEHKDRRDEAKVPNFLIPYGGFAANLASQLENCTVERAQEILDKHRQTFPTLWNYLEESAAAAKQCQAAWDMFGRRRLFITPNWDRAIAEIQETAREEEGSRWEKWMRKEPKAFGIQRPKWTEMLWEQTVEQEVINYIAKFQKKPTDDELFDILHAKMPQPWMVTSMIKSMFGRIERQGKNHPIQGTNASMIKLAMGAGHDTNGKPYLWHVLPKYNAKLLAMVHDELLIQVPKRHAGVVAELAVDAFKRAGAEKFKALEMLSDYHIADHWQK